MIDWDSIKQGMNKILNIQDDKAYLLELIDNIEIQYEANNSLPFRISDIKERGFIIKVAGLFGFISFHHMPWEYKYIDNWKAAFPHLLGKILFCKIHHFSKDPIAIIINGKIPQFKKPDLVENLKYKSIVLNKTNFGVFVDIGFHFKWECGSIVGLLHKLNFETGWLFDEIDLGEEIEVIYWGIKENGHYIFGLQHESKEWFTGEIEARIGETVEVNVSKSQNGKISFLIEDKYAGFMDVSTLIYKEKCTQIRDALKNLQDGDVILCEIIFVNLLKRILHLKWNADHEIEESIARKPAVEQHTSIRNVHKILRNQINGGTVEKLELIGKLVNVEVIKTEKKSGKCLTNYQVENKFKGRLTMSNDSYVISNKEKEQIEENLQDGETLICEVIAVDKSLVKVRWKLKDNELNRFLES